MVKTPDRKPIVYYVVVAMQLSFLTMACMSEKLQLHMYERRETEELPRPGQRSDVVPSQGEGMPGQCQASRIALQQIGLQKARLDGYCRITTPFL